MKILLQEQKINLIEWQAVYGGLDGFRRGLEETIAWFSEPANLVRYKSDVYNV